MEKTVQLEHELAVWLAEDWYRPAAHERQLSLDALYSPGAQTVWQSVEESEPAEDVLPLGQLEQEVRSERS